MGIFQQSKDIKHRIQNKGKAFRQAPIPLPKHHAQEVIRQIEEQLKQGLSGEWGRDEIELCTLTYDGFTLDAPHTGNPICPSSEFGYCIHSRQL